MWRWSREAKLVSLVLVATVGGSGCGAALSGVDTEEAEGPSPARLAALFPPATEGDVRVDRYDDHVALVRAGRVYGSTGEDMPGQVTGMLAGLALAPAGPHMLRVGVVGFGTGTGTGVALAAGSRVVDVFEQSEPMVRAGESLAGRTGLTYHEGAPIHPSLRIVGPGDMADERLARYDVILSPPATTAVAGPRRLVLSERLEGLAALLGTDGLLVHHVPAYEVTPEGYRRMLRTFAHAFAHVVVIAAGPQSGDTFVVGSQQPLRLRPASLRSLTAASSLDAFRRGGELETAMDLAARVLFASREEVLAFADGASTLSVSSPLAESDAPPRPAMPAADAAEPERATWQEAMVAHRARFERMDLIRQQMLGLDWRFGQICPDGIYSRSCILADVEADGRGATVLAELSLSLMAVGRFAEARVTLASAVTIGAPMAVVEAMRVQALLLEDMPDLSSQVPTSVLSEEVEAAAAGACEDATASVEEALSGAGAPEGERRLVAAWVVATCSPEDPEAMAVVARALEPLASERSLAERYPALTYLLARAAIVTGAYPTATWAMLRYVRQVGSEPPPPAPAAD